MDFFQALNDECHISSSQEEILNPQPISGHSQDDLGILSDENEANPGQISATSTGIFIRSALCNTSGDEEAPLHENPSTDAIDAANSKISEVSKRKSTFEDDPVLAERTTKKCRVFDGQFTAERNLGFSDSKGDLSGGNTARDLSNMQRSAVSSLPKINHVGNVDVVDNAPDLGISRMNLKESSAGKGNLPTEKDLGFFERMKFLISMGTFPDLGFLKSKGDSSMLPRTTNFDKTSAIDASLNVVAGVCGSNGTDLGFRERGVEKPHISKEKSPKDFDFSKSKGDSSDKFTARCPEDDINAKESYVAKGKSPVVMNLGFSKSKRDSLSEFSCKDMENFQKELQNVVGIKDVNALDSFHDLTGEEVFRNKRNPPDKGCASISKNKSLIEKIPDITKSPGDLPGPEKEKPKGPIHEDLGSSRLTAKDVGRESSRHPGDAEPTDEFARFRYCKSGNPPKYRQSTHDTEDVVIASNASRNVWVSRKLPPSLQGQSVEKVGVSDTGAKSSGVSSQNDIIKSLLDFMKELSKESDQCVGDEDILEVALRAGYTFPRPRWWQPGDYSYT